MTDAPTFLWTPEDTSGSSGQPAVAPVSRSERHLVEGLPGEVGLWVFVLGDMSIFGAFFSVFSWELRQDRATFSESAAALLQPIGVTNTLLLLVSSYAVVRALHSYRGADLRRCRAALLVATGCGAGFLAMKVVEYSTELRAGHTPASNEFFTFYFVMTGVHALHVLIGIVLLTVWGRRLPASSGSVPTRGFVEGASVYWHMVDLLWIVIFGLLYLGAGT